MGILALMRGCRVPTAVVVAAVLLVSCPAQLAVAWDPIKDFEREVGNCFSGGCDVVWHLNRQVDSGIRSKASSMAEPFRQAFVDAMHQVFASEVNPLIDKLNLIGLNYFGEAQKLADEIGARAEAIIERAGDQVSANIVLFRQQVIETAGKEARALVADIGGRVDKLIDDLRCAAEGAQKGAAEWVKQQITWFGSSNPCWVEYGARWKAPASDDYIKIFRIRECEIRRSISDAKTVRGLLDGYSALNIWARGMRCIATSARSSAGTRPMEEVEEESNRAYSLWYFASNPSVRSSQGVPQ